MGKPPLGRREVRSSQRSACLKLGEKKANVKWELTPMWSLGHPFSGTLRRWYTDQVNSADKPSTSIVEPGAYFGARVVPISPFSYRLWAVLLSIFFPFRPCQTRCGCLDYC